MLRNILFILLLAAGAGIAFYYFREVSGLQNEIQKLRTSRDRSENQLKAERVKTDSLVQLLRAMPDTTTSPTDEPAKRALKKLEALGMIDPASELLTSLQKQSALLPQRGSMGGNMTYRNLTVLTEHLALGYFEDGHTGGYAALRYDAINRNAIVWQLLGYHPL